MPDKRYETGTSRAFLLWKLQFNIPELQLPVTTIDLSFSSASEFLSIGDASSRIFL